MKRQVILAADIESGWERSRRPTDDPEDDVCVEVNGHYVRTSNDGDGCTRPIKVH